MFSPTVTSNQPDGDVLLQTRRLPLHFEEGYDVPSAHSHDGEEIGVSTAYHSTRSDLATQHVSG